MQAPSNYKGYTARVFFRPRKGLGSFEVSGWCYELSLNGERVNAGGNLATEEAARAEAKAALRWDMQQKGAR